MTDYLLLNGLFALGLVALAFIVGELVSLLVMRMTDRRQK